MLAVCPLALISRVTRIPQVPRVAPTQSQYAVPHPRASAKPDLAQPGTDLPPMNLDSPPPVRGSARTEFTPILLLLFAASGTAALIYEVVWFRLLRLIVGGSSTSLGFLLGAFMGGMGLGSLLRDRNFKRQSRSVCVRARTTGTSGAATDGPGSPLRRTPASQSRYSESPTR